MGLTKVNNGNSGGTFRMRRRIRPPRLYVLVIVMGISAGIIWPVNMFSPWAQAFFGPLIMVTGFLLKLWAVREFRQSGTCVPAHKPTTRLVTTGPYRYTRNPMFISSSVFLFGLGVLVDSLWLILMLVPLIIYIHTRFVRREEAFLRMKFGDAYQAYALRVRRWI